MKTTIRANEALVIGDYVVVKNTPFKTTRFCLWIILSLILTASFINGIDILIIISTFFVFLIIDSILSTNEATYTIPKRDLVAIKRYPGRHKVTVVFDDEMNKLYLLQDNESPLPLSLREFSFSDDDSSPPGHRELSLISFLVSSKKLERVYKPIVSDWNAEHYAALKKNKPAIRAFLIRIRYMYALISALGLTSILKTAAFFLIRK